MSNKKQMLKKLKNKIEEKRNSKKVFWKSLVFIKDFIWKISSFFSLYFRFLLRQKRFRLSPNFIIIGAMKSGTTSLYNYLKEHHDIFMSNIKEPNLFLDSKKKIKFPSIHTTNAEAKMGLSNRALRVRMLMGYKGQKAIGEASASYSKAPLQGTEVPKNIKKEFPNMRFVYILRNPIDRIVSHYLHIMRKYYEKANYQDLNSVFESNSEFFISLSLYYYQLSNYLKYFPKENFKIVIFEEFIKNPRSILKEIFEFLLVDYNFKYVSRFKVYNKSINRRRFPESSLKFTKENYDKLINPIKKDINKMEKFLGRSLNIWDLSKERWCL